MNNDDIGNGICTINEIDPEAVAFVQERALPELTI